MKKTEIIIYLSITVILAIVCLGVLIVHFKNEDNYSNSLKQGNSNEPKKVGKINKKVKKSSKWKNYTPKHKDKKIYIPDDLDLNAIVAKFNSPMPDDIKSDLLGELYGTKHPKILAIVNKELDNPNEEIRIEALELLSEFGNEEIFNVLEKALNDKSADVREVAIDLLDTVDIPGGSNIEADLLSKGIADKSEDVRNVALSVMGDKPKYEIEIIAETAIRSKYIEVKEEILGELSAAPTMNGVEIIISGMQDKNEEFRDSVRDTLEDITDQEFASYEDALQWWNKNGSKYQEEFQENEDDDEEVDD